MSVSVDFMAQWIMPLFFLLSGLSVYYSLSHRTRGQFVRERFKRLAIPFLFGTFVVLIPLQVYIKRVSHSQFAGSFIEFYPHYFAWMGLHLWYLEMLFIFFLITLPLFLYLRKEAVHGSISRAVLFFRKPWAIFLLAIPPGVMELLVDLQPEGTGIRDFGGWSLAIYQGLLHLRLPDCN